MVFRLTGDGDLARTMFLTFPCPQASDTRERKVTNGELAARPRKYALSPVLLPCACGLLTGFRSALVTSRKKASRRGGLDVWRTAFTGARKYQPSNLPVDTSLKRLAGAIIARWVGKQANQQLREDRGL